MRKRLTKPVCNSRPPADSQQRLEIWDTDLPGFGIRIWKSEGRKDLKDPAERTFFIMYRDAAGKLRRYTIGSFHKLDLADAKKDAREEFRKISHGDYPHIRKRRAKLQSAGKTAPGTWENLIERFLESGAGGKRGKLREATAREYGRLLRNHVLPHWKGRTLDEVTAADVLDIVQSKRKKSPFMANRLLAVISSLCTWASNPEHAYLNSNPTAGLKKAPEAPRKRKLSDDELRALWQACEDEAYPYGRVYQVAMVLGQRPGEISGMQWPELDLKNARWTIPAARTKTDRDHVIPLPQLALDILNELPRFEDNPDQVFQAGNGKLWLNSKVKARADEKMRDNLAKIQRRKPESVKIEAWQWRDLRRTVRTNLAQLGVTHEIGERILNHSFGQSEIAAVYDTYHYEPEKRAALDKWAARLEAIIAANDQKVVAMRGQQEAQA